MIPLYTQEQFEQALSRDDDRKFQACLEHGIALCIIDTSSLRYFKESKAQKYLDIVVSVIKQKLATT